MKIVDIYVKKTNKKYKTNYGVPFQCVELIRRVFSTVMNVSFPDVVDAVEFFNNINFLSNSRINVKLDTFSYQYTNNYLYYLNPWSILFWKYKKPNFPYGHVALVLDSNEKETIVIQQNLNPPVKIYDTKDLFQKMNCPDSKFLGVKTLPMRFASGFRDVDYNVVKV